MEILVRLVICQEGIKLFGLISFSLPNLRESTNTVDIFIQPLSNHIQMCQLLDFFFFSLPFFTFMLLGIFSHHGKGIFQQSWTQEEKKKGGGGWKKREKETLEKLQKCHASLLSVSARICRCDIVFRAFHLKWSSQKKRREEREMHVHLAACKKCLVFFCQFSSVQNYPAVWSLIFLKKNYKYLKGMPYY